MTLLPRQVREVMARCRFSADDRAIDIDGGGAGFTVTDFLRDRSGDIRWLRVRGRAFARVPVGA